MIVKLIKSLFSNSSAADLRDFLSQQPILLDVRTRAEFMGGSIQGAQNVPLGDLTSSMNRLNKNEPFVVFCRSGNRSAQAVGLLKRNGFQRVINGGSMRQVELVLETTKKI